jgi:predicted peptidase
MKKFIFIIFHLAFVTFSLAQNTIKVTNGAMSIQIKVSTKVAGRAYYVIYNKDLTTVPHAADIKTTASSSTTTNIERKGFFTIDASIINDTVTRSIINIPSIKADTIKYFYVYSVFESTATGLGVVQKDTLAFRRRQPAYSFKSTTLSTTGLTTVNYLVYLPESYHHDLSGKKYPMIVSFHGDGQKGNNIDQVRTDQLPKYLEGSISLDFIVVAPQQNGDTQTWEKPSFVQELVDLMKQKFRVDTNRIYGNGCSGGGGGMYFYAYNYPSVFAAMSPMSGTNYLFIVTKADYCKLKDIPFWGFHSDGDNQVTLNNMKVVIDNVTKCGPLVPMKKTIYKGSIHDCWKYPLNQDSVYRFFLARDKTTKTNVVEAIVFDTNITVVKNSLNLALVDFKGLVNDPTYKYFWYQKSGADLTFKDQDSRMPTLINPSLGTYKLRLMLQKPNGNTNYRDVVITVANVVTENEDIVLGNEFENWSIFDLKGVKIREGVNSKVDISDLKENLYIVKTDQSTHKIYLNK